MKVCQYFVSYTSTPGRYLVFRIEKPGWVSIVDHVEADGSCLLIYQGCQSLDRNVQGETFDADAVAETTEALMKDVASWFEPFPICQAEDPARAEQLRWMFGTWPFTSDNRNAVIAVRLFEAPQVFAELLFDDKGQMAEITVVPNGLADEVIDAFADWKRGGLNDSSRARFSYLTLRR